MWCRLHQLLKEVWKRIPDMDLRFGWDPMSLEVRIFFCKLPFLCCCSYINVRQSVVMLLIDVIQSFHGVYNVIVFLFELRKLAASLFFLKQQLLFRSAFHNGLIFTIRAGQVLLRVLHFLNQVTFTTLTTHLSLCGIFSKLSVFTK